MSMHAVESLAFSLTLPNRNPRIRLTEPAVARTRGRDAKGNLWLHVHVPAGQPAVQCTLCGKHIRHSWLQVGGIYDVCASHVALAHK